MEVVKNMCSCLVLVFVFCSIAHSEESTNSIAGTGGVPATRPLNSTDTQAPSPHIHVHQDANVTSSNQNITQDESAYFVSAFFRKYGHSNELTLDGFARLLCSLGLVPSLTETTEQAVDTFQSGGHESLDCKKVTFKEVQAIFDEEAARAAAHEHGEEDHHDHVDGHSDHDHQPNRNGGGGGSKPGSSSAQGGDAHHYDDHGSNHSDHDHDHHHGDAGQGHEDHDHSQHHHGEEDHNEVDSDIDTKNSNAVHSSHNKAGVDSQTSSQAQADSSANRRTGREAAQGYSSSSGSGPQNIQTLHIHPNHSLCTSPSKLLEHFHIPLKNLTASDFLSLCPALLFEIDSKVCKKTSHAHHHDDEVAVIAASFSSIPGKVWGFSVAAVLVISLAGLLGVAVIPIMQKVLYNHLLQFLVAVAVGALSGDALLHLLPHAIAKNLQHDEGSHDDHGHSSHDDKEHLEAVWKGLTALLCIFFFFLIERVLTIVTEKKRRKKAMDRLKKKRCERLCNKENTGGVGAKLAAHEEGDYANCDQMVMVVHPNKALKGYADATHEVLLHQCDERQSQTDPPLDTDVDETVAALGHSHTHHGHGHGHGHGHTHCDTVPGSVAAVAWMVILGDGIHNFSDGLAIGAAFANGVTGGISTSVAVLCHELPHEIGDFAVLLRAGMSVKQAIVYNCVSSILCFMGMLVGVAIGNIHNASLWVFAGVAGMFLYISMVDMLPEMTAVDTKKGENQYLHLLLQVCGMLIGSGIMLVIAVYEHDLQRSLG